MKTITEELRKADRIINVMLNAMTLKQKSKCAALLDAEGISQAGMTRSNERAAVIASAIACKPSDTSVINALQGLVDIASQIDFDECPDIYNQLQGAIALSREALK